tara:strand:- start:376 stop:714 length:339 start_codon:yes stop_codon:yes gene_type:complete
MNFTSDREERTHQGDLYRMYAAISLAIIDVLFLTIGFFAVDRERRYQEAFNEGKLKGIEIGFIEASRKYLPAQLENILLKQQNLKLREFYDRSTNYKRRFESNPRVDEVDKF